MAQFEVSDIVRALHEVRDEWRDSQRRSREPGAREFPSRDALTQIVESLEQLKQRLKGRSIADKVIERRVGAARPRLEIRQRGLTRV